MENVDMSQYQQAQQGYANLAQNASTYNNFVGQLLGFDATYGSLENLQATKMQNAFNSAEASKSRNWQEYMSNTANQRAVEDLKKAGFSPLALLGNSSGASTPSGATASSSASGGSSGSKSGDMMKNLLSTMLMLGMSSANLKTKANIAAADRVTRQTIADADRVTRSNMNSANIASKMEMAERSRSLKKELAQMPLYETEDTIKTKGGFHRVKHSKRN